MARPHYTGIAVRKVEGKVSVVIQDECHNNVQVIHVDEQMIQEITDAFDDYMGKHFEEKADWRWNGKTFQLSDSS